MTSRLFMFSPFLLSSSLVWFVRDGNVSFYFVSSQSVYLFTIIIMHFVTQSIKLFKVARRHVPVFIMSSVFAVFDCFSRR